MSDQWVMISGYEVAKKRARPAIYRLKSGGYLIRGRVTNAKTGRRDWIIRVLHGSSIEEAQRTLDDLKEQARTLGLGKTPSSTLFCDFAVAVWEHKEAAGEIKGASPTKWKHSLPHLIRAFGALECRELTYEHIMNWHKDIGLRIKNGTLSYRKAKELNRPNDAKLSPTTANGWLSILRHLCVRMCAQYRLPVNPAAGVPDFDTSQHETYTFEQPNSFADEEARTFLEAMKRLEPGHYAMTYLGLITGLRASSLRPLRRKGPECDILWGENAILVRRSNGVGQVIIKGTKTGQRYRIGLPDDAMDVLREHVALIENPPRNKWGQPPRWWRPPMAESDLLFPSRTGGMKSNNCMKKPIRKVKGAIGMTDKRITPIALRRTFNDVARNASVPDIVTRAISGHQTEKMQRHYSTLYANETRMGVAKVKLQLVGGTDVEGTKKGTKRAAGGGDDR